MFLRNGQRVYSVLGMHRSGTSCMAGILEEAGVVLGRVSRSNPHNKKGNREHPDIMALHNNLFLANGGDWQRPPESVVWEPEHQSRRDAVISEYAGQRVWGFKDPRTLFALGGWLEVIPELNFVGIVRHPLAVAQSLFRRSEGALAIEKGVDIWTRYNRRLLWYRRQFDFPIISFDLQAEQFQEKVNILLGELGLPATGTLEFFDPTLRHVNAVPASRLPKESLEVYQEIMRYAA